MNIVHSFSLTIWYNYPLNPANYHNSTLGFGCYGRWLMTGNKVVLFLTLETSSDWSLWNPACLICKPPSWTDARWKTKYLNLHLSAQNTLHTHAWCTFHTWQWSSYEKLQTRWGEKSPVELQIQCFWIQKTQIIIRPDIKQQINDNGAKIHISSLFWRVYCPHNCCTSVNITNMLEKLHCVSSKISRGKFPQPQTGWKSTDE